MFLQLTLKQFPLFAIRYLVYSPYPNSSLILRSFAVETFPDLVKERTPPTRHQTRRSSLFTLERNQLLLQSHWTLATFQQVRMNVLTGAVG